MDSCGEKALLAPDDHNIIDTLAEAWYAAGRPEVAVTWEREALLLDPENPFYISQLEKFTRALEETESVPLVENE